MASIQFVDRGTAPQVGPRGRILANAAATALAAPTLLGGQPWRWRISEGSAQLRADRRRLVTAPDPDGRLLMISCGAALNYARTALAAGGFRSQVRYLPDPVDPDLLAEVRLGDAAPASPAALRLFRAVAIRRTDRRPLADTPIPPAALHLLRAAADAYGVHTRFPYLRSPVRLAAHTHHRPARGVPHAKYPAIRVAVLFADADTPRDWLAAGEALSAVLLTATADGLATAPMSDLLKTPETRELLRDLTGGVGHPAMVVRIGQPATGTPPVHSPGRSPTGALVPATHVPDPTGGGS